MPAQHFREFARMVGATRALGRFLTSRFLQTHDVGLRGLNHLDRLA